ncbi:hypothetical protein BCV02_01475 [Vibrio breoganii]|uniref:EpsG family protein n=1 Tax=Vibrio breoganii TaxID=553239 RepID=A0AAP8MU39_9VIBR|nr:EpsG family protein [Vibrio breoganii]NMO74127.1 hypothetical protein [Vibrio breoganii]NMR70872.1 hypothetical protein [Vibrio breoganii]PMG02925.1 hypothetical protein BCV02_01475 [Vibrio breoganii]PML88189.1 hypothetical protein BCT67_10780 [Vibrio breoganii]PMP05666.1 hypothetical protein BCS93_18530 [Vibrio breoganii]
MKIKLVYMIFFVSLPLVVLYSYFVSITSNGPDYANYLLIIERVLEQETFTDMLRSGKDPSFSLFVLFANPSNSDHYFMVFLYIILVSTIIKFTFLPKSVLKASTYCILYLFLIAPGLDFAAIRSLLAISFFVWFVSIEDKESFFKKTGSYLVLIFSVASHTSVFIPVLFSTKYFTKFLKILGISGTFIVFMLSVPVVVYVIIYLFPEKSHYFSSRASIISIFFNAFYLLSSLSLLLYSNYFLFDKYIGRLIKLGYGLVLFGFFSFPSVILSGRILEFFAFIQLIVIFNLKINHKKYKRFVPLVWFSSLFFLTVPLVRKAYMMDLWAVF